MVYSSAASSDHVQPFTVDIYGNMSGLTAESVTNTPRYLAASPDGKYLYASEMSNGDLYTFTILPSGSLTLDSSNNTLAYAPGFMFFDRLARWLMFPLVSGSPFHSMDYNPADGTLNNVSGSPFALASGIGQGSASPIDDTMFLPFTSGNVIKAYGIGALGNPIFDQQSTVGDVTQPYAVAAHPTNLDWVYATSGDTGQVVQFIYTMGVSLVTGQIAGTYVSSTAAKDIRIHPTLDKMYVLYEDGTSSYLNEFNINPATGDHTLAASYDLMTVDPGAMTIDSLGRFIFIQDCLNNTIKVFDLAPGTGVAALTSTWPTAGTCPDGITSVYLR